MEQVGSFPTERPILACSCSRWPMHFVGGRAYREATLISSWCATLIPHYSLGNQDSHSSRQQASNLYTTLHTGLFSLSQNVTAAKSSLPASKHAPDNFKLRRPSDSPTTEATTNKESRLYAENRNTTSRFTAITECQIMANQGHAVCFRTCSRDFEFWK